MIDWVFRVSSGTQAATSQGTLSSLVPTRSMDGVAIPTAFLDGQAAGDLTCPHKTLVLVSEHGERGPFKTNLWDTGACQWAFVLVEKPSPRGAPGGAEPGS